ncbi:MAG: hypothetical protein ACRETP_03700 [Steroidobacteraceae bacterium]
MKFKTSTFLITALLGVLSTPVCLAQTKIITFEAPGADTTQGSFNGTVPASINNFGAVTGTYYDVNNVGHGFLRSREGDYTTIDPPGSEYTQGTSINDLGVIAGDYYDAAGNEHGFLRSPGGRFTTFDVSQEFDPVALNLEGAIVGYSLDQNSLFQAFLRSPDGKITTFVGPRSCTGGLNVTPPCYGNEATSINVFGASLGNDMDNNLVGHGFVRSPDGKLTEFDAPGAGTGQYQGTGCPGCFSGLNAAGAVASIYTDASYVFHSFLRSPEGRFTTIDAPGAGTGAGQGTGCSSDCPTALNDWGAVAGNYIDANNVFHGFLRSPDGKLTEFDAPGAGTAAGQGTACQFCGLGLNDFGEIAGTYLDANNVYHGFLRLPCEARRSSGEPRETMEKLCGQSDSDR